MVEVGTCEWVTDWPSSYVLKKHSDTEKVRERWMKARGVMTKRAGCRARSSCRGFAYTAQYAGRVGIDWHENGLKSQAIEVKNGQRDGIWTEWNNKGHVTKIETYKSGKLVN